MAKVIYYSGRVQGVGFRATVAEIARGYPVVGWVRNLPDGRVQVLVEGSDAAVEEFLATIRQRWAGHIRGEHIEQREPTEQHTGFTIVRRAAVGRGADGILPTDYPGCRIVWSVRPPKRISWRNPHRIAPIRHLRLPILGRGSPRPCPWSPRSLTQVLSPCGSTTGW